MNHKVKLSIGIPTYNQGNTIEETINSILNQTDAVYEIVVSNNHCTDNTAEVLAKFGDKIKVVVPPTHLPMSANWNFCLQHMSGDWGFLISSDDIMLPNYAQTFYENVREDTALMFYGYNIIDGDSKITLADKRIRTARRLQSFPKNFIEEISGPKVSFGAYTIRLDKFRQIGYFDPRVVLDCDWATWLRLAPLGKFQYIPETVCSYRSCFRPGFDQARLQQETADQVVVRTQIIPEIMEQYHVRSWFHRWCLIKNAKGRYELHCRLKDPHADEVPAKFGVTMDQIRRFNRLQAFIIRVNDLLFKL
jgi:glycosyltransferase involved in cell wall biosynthesis